MLQTAEPTLNVIKKTILKHYGILSNAEIAELLGVTRRKLAGSLKTLVVDGLIPRAEKPVYIPRVKKEKTTIVKIPKINVPSTVKIGVFTNEEGVNKVNGRQITKEALLKFPFSEKPILTLAGSKCIFELGLLKTNPNNYSFSTAETDREKYYEALQTIVDNKLNMSAYFGKIGDLIETAKENQYSHAILDYCCQLSTAANDIETILKRNIVEVNGIITITINKRIANNSPVIYDALENINPMTETDKITRCEHALNTLILVSGGFRYAIEKRFNYKDTSSMVLFVLRRIS